MIDAADFHPSVPDVIAPLKREIPRFADAGVVLALENHDRFRASDFVQILETVDSPSLGICLDTVRARVAVFFTNSVVNSQPILLRLIKR